MYEDNLLAGKGLKLLYISQVLNVISAILGEGVLPGLVSLVALILAWVGLSTAAPTHPYFRTALQVNIALVVLDVVSIVLTGLQLAVPAVLLLIAEMVLNVLSVYLVCTAAGQLLTVNGYVPLAAKGVTVWKLYLACSVAVVVFMVLSLVPFLLFVAGVLVLGTTVAMLVDIVLYMIFLYHASNALLMGQ